MITVVVCGMPRPQGSMTAWRDPQGRTRIKYRSTIYEWRGLVTATVRAELEGPPIDEPLAVELVFDLPRPASHLGTGRNSGRLRPSAPAWPATAPDLDKLVRGVLDGITDAGTLWKDDSQVVRLVAEKRYLDPSTGDVPGVTIRADVC